jgi:ribosomal protein S6
MAWKKSIKADFGGKMEDLVQSSYRKLPRPMQFIRNGFGSRYACLLYAGMELTNDLAEQAKGRHVVIRKIIRTFRSESGS